MCQICSVFTPHLDTCSYEGIIIDSSVETGPLWVPGDTVTETGDAAAATSTTSGMGVGEYFMGELSSNNDSDWIEITLVAGTYTIASVGVGPLDQAVNDTYLRLRDASGVLYSEDDDGGPGVNSDITVTITETTTFFVDVQSWNNSDSGTYGVSVTEGTVASFNAEMIAGNLMRPNEAWTTTPGVGETDLTWAVRATGNDPSNDSPLIQLNANQIALTAEILDYLEGFSGLNFTQVNPGGTSNNATMLFGAYQASDGAGAYAYYPGSTAGGSTGFSSNAGDVWLNNNSYGSGPYEPGSFGHFAMMHEIGHALGLAHPGDYNAGVGVSITYANNAQFIEDSHQYTVMSYFDESNTGATNLGYPDTFMLADYMAIHQLYGVDTNYNAGNTIYGFNASEADSVYDFTENTTPFMTVYDGQGTDTIDLSGYTMDQWLTLEEGVFSNVGGFTGNFSIAYGAVIENATGGSGDDTLMGNDAANSLDGGSGADTIYGGEGDDTITGGSGDDVALYEESFFDFSLSSSGALSFTVAGTSAANTGTDQLSGIEELQFSDGTFDGTIFTTDTLEDVADAFGWTSSFETYDIDAKRVSRTVVYDNGLVAETSYEDGVRTSVTTTDEDDLFNWASTLDIYDANGDRTSQTKILDNGLNTETSYENGVKVTVSKTDASDSYTWENTTDTYDANGDVVGRSITYDDQRVVETVFADGIKVSTTRIDAIDEFTWDRLKNTFDTDGARLTTELTYDSGLKTATTYDDGAIISTLTTDAADEFIWASIERRFDSGGTTEGMTNIYDDGRVLESEFINGVRSTATMTDVEDAHTWANYVDSYDTSGTLVERVMTFDDGSESTWTF